MQKRQKRSVMIAVTILFALLICGTVSATDMTGAWNSSGDGVYTSTAGDVQVNASAKTYWWKGSWTDVGNGTTNPNGSFFSNPQAANHKSLQSTFGGSGILTFNFSENVTNPILHIDRIGSAVKHGKAYSSTSAKFTSEQPIVKLTGPNHFTVTSNSFYRTPYQSTNGNPEASWFSYKGTAAGSIKFIGTFDSISLYWTSLGKCNLDEIEFVWELKKPKSKLVVTKSGTPNSVNAGEQLTYSMSIKNKGPSVARNVSFTDTLPAALTNAQYSLDNINWAIYTSGQSIGLGDLNVGQTVQFWIRGIVDAATQPGKISNTVTAFIKGKESGNATVKNNVTSKSDLVVSKSGIPSIVKAGELLTYNMSIKNNGPSVARNVSFRDTLPAVLTNVEYSLNGSNWFAYISGQSVSLGDLNVNQTVNFWIRGIVDAATQPGKIINTVTAYINGTESGNATVKNNVTSKSDLLVSKSGIPSTVKAGELLTYNMSIKNNGPSVARNVSFRDTLPAVLTNVEYSLNGSNWFAYISGQSVSLGDLNVNQTVNFWIRGVVDAATQPGKIINTVTAYINGTESGNATANNTVVSKSKLTVTKNGTPSTVKAGELLTYNMSIKNNGPSVAYNVSFRDTLPAVLTNVEYSLNGSNWFAYISGQSVSLGDLNVNQTVNFWIRGVVDAATQPGKIINTVTAFINGTESGNATVKNNVTSKSDLLVSKSGTPSTVKAGGQLTYNMSIKNNGPSVAYNVSFRDTLPAVLTNVEYSLNGSNWFAYISGQSISLGNINVNQTVLFWIRGVVDAATQPGKIINTVTAYINGTESGNATANNTVVSKSKLTVTKNGTPSTVKAGELLTYNMSIKNNGPSVARNVSFRDTLPATLTNAQYSLDNINWAIYTSGQSVNLGDLNVNQTVNFWIRGIVDAATQPGKISNTVTAFINGTDSGNATANNTVTNNAALTITKTPDKKPAQYNVDDTVTYTIKVKNIGVSTAHNVIVTDTVSKGLQYIGSSEGGSLSAGVVTWNVGNLASGAEVIRTVTFKVLSAAAGKIVVNTATAVHSLSKDPASTTASIYVPSADLVLSKTVDNSKPNIKDTIHFTLIVNNLGPDTAVDVEVADKLPSGLSFVSSTANFGTYDPITGIWSIGSLPNGARAVLTIAAIVENSGQITNEAKVSSVTYDPNIDANTAGVTIDVQEPQPPEPPIDPVNPVVDAANTVAMQPTGMPIAGIVLALFLLSAGLLMPRRKQ